MGNAQSGNSLNNASLALTIWATFTMIKSGLREVRKAVVSHYPHGHLEKINITFAEARELVIGDQRERLGDLEARRILLSQDADNAWNATRWWDWERYLPSTYRGISRNCEQLRKDIDEFVDSLLGSDDMHSAVTPPPTPTSVQPSPAFQHSGLSRDVSPDPSHAVSRDLPSDIPPDIPPATHLTTSPASPTASSSVSSDWDGSTAVPSKSTTPAPDESSASPVQDIELAHKITSAEDTLEARGDTEARGADAEKHAAATVPDKMADTLLETPVGFTTSEGHTTGVQVAIQVQASPARSVMLRKPLRSRTEPPERDSPERITKYITLSGGRHLNAMPW